VYTCNDGTYTSLISPPSFFSSLFSLSSRSPPPTSPASYTLSFVSPSAHSSDTAQSPSGIRSPGMITGRQLSYHEVTEISM